MSLHAVRAECRLRGKRYNRFYDRTADGVTAAAAAAAVIEWPQSLQVICTALIEISNERELACHVIFDSIKKRLISCCSNNKQ